MIRDIFRLMYIKELLNIDDKGDRFRLIYVKELLNIDGKGDIF